MEARKSSFSVLAATPKGSANALRLKMGRLMKGADLRDPPDPGFSTCRRQDCASTSQDSLSPGSEPSACGRGVVAPYE